MGNFLTPSTAKSRPEIHATFSPDGSPVAQIQSSSTTKYTLVLTDPDAPSRTDKAYSEYAHHIVTNLTLNSGSTKNAAAAGTADFDAAEAFAAALDYSKGTELLSYVGPAPPPKTGKHRYIYILFLQKEGVEPKYEGERFRFGTEVPGTGVRSWAAKYELKPVAVNFFYSQNDEQ